MNEQRAELHLHTKMSDDISIIGVREMLKNAKDYGLSAIAFTNLNNVLSYTGNANECSESPSSLNVLEDDNPLIFSK